MTRVLLTAFEPYGPWTENAAWMLLQHLTQKLPTEPQITTRLYPVEFAALRECLSSDLQKQLRCGFAVRTSSWKCTDRTRVDRDQCCTASRNET